MFSDGDVEGHKGYNWDTYLGIFTRAAWVAPHYHREHNLPATVRVQDNLLACIYFVYLFLTDFALCAPRALAVLRLHHLIVRQSWA